MPGNLKHALFDEVHWVSAELADHFTRKLYASTGHFRGPTTGAAYAVVRSVRDRCPDTPIVFLATTVPATSARPSPRIPTVPHTIDFVRSRSAPTAYDAETEWAWMNWNRSDIHRFQ